MLLKSVHAYCHHDYCYMHACMYALKLCDVYYSHNNGFVYIYIYICSPLRGRFKGTDRAVYTVEPCGQSLKKCFLKK